MLIILGSSSPRRREILYDLCPDMVLINPSVDEELNPGEGPVAFVRRISEEKACSVYDGLENRSRETLIITGDTVVSIGGTILGKPGNYDEACVMLRLLSSRTHVVISGLTLMHLDNGHVRCLTGHESTDVTFKDLGDHDIHEYLSLITYFDKAGSYAIQDHGERIINTVTGSVSNVIGFPLRLFYRSLSDMGLLFKIVYPVN